MKNIAYLICSLFFLAIINGCSEDDRDLDFINNIGSPSNIALLVELTQDNSGLVTLTPSGDNASVFTISFGDGTEETVDVLPGENISHVYEEGSYTATVIAKSLNGNTVEFTQPIVISFLPPENLQINVSPVDGDAFSVNVSASADLAVGFEVFFGDVDEEIATPLMVGETIQHTYPDVGTYMLKVVALSGGAETTEATVEVVIENPIVLPIDFESSTIEYNFESFGGASAAVIDNPDASGANTSAKVAEFFKDTGAEIFAGTILQLGAPIDFSEFTGFKLNSWSPQAGITVKLKLENAADPSISAEIDATTTVANSWETLFFSFASADLTQEYSKVIVFFDFGNTGVGETHYFDNIEQANGDDTLLSLPIDFESDVINYNFVDFGGAQNQVIDNPDPSGENASPKVAEFFKENGAEIFAGTILELPEPIDFSEFQTFTMSSWSPTAGLTVKLKIENAADGGISAEIDATTTVENGWETLVFDFSGTDFSQEYSKIVVFFDFGNTGTGDTFYYDNISLNDGSGGGPVVELPVDFENPDLTYEIIGFEGADSELIANEVSGGINTSGNVVRTIKTNGAQFFAGTIVQLDQAIDFSSTQSISVKTYSPKADIPVRLKLETQDGSQFVELDVNTTTTDAWEELVWDFSGQDTSPAFTKVVIFFEFVVDLPGDGSTYYFDDIELSI